MTGAANHQATDAAPAPADVRRLVDCTAAAIERHRPEDEIVRGLIDAGVSPRDAPAVCRIVRDAFQLGALAAYLGKPPDPAGGRANDPLAGAAFDAGYAAFSRRSAGAALRGLLGVPLILAAGVALLLVLGALLSACD